MERGIKLEGRVEIEEARPCSESRFQTEVLQLSGPLDNSETGD